MDRANFKKWYKSGEMCGNIVKSDLFNCAGYFWINLTSKQLDAMYKLMKAQGAVETEEGISLENGIRINKRYV